MARAIVLDASAWLAVLLKEQGSSLLEPLLEEHPLYAPELIRYAVANGLIFAKRRKRPLAKKLSQLLTIVWEFPIEIVPFDAFWAESLRLAEKHDPTFYDATYLAVACILELPLLTLDTKVIKAGESEEVEILKTFD